MQKKDEQNKKIEDLSVSLKAAGAKNPHSWASSEVTEGIPQFARFLVLKRLFEIANSTKDNIDYASDFDEKLESKLDNLKEKIGEKELYSILSSYAKGIIYNVIELLDEGNINSDRDKISWVLMKTDENDELTYQVIQGLHENFIDFENEIEY